MTDGAGGTKKCEGREIRKDKQVGVGWGVGGGDTRGRQLEDAEQPEQVRDHTCIVLWATFQVCIVVTDSMEEVIFIIFRRKENSL